MIPPDAVSMGKPGMEIGRPAAQDWRPRSGHGSRPLRTCCRNAEYRSVGCPSIKLSWMRSASGGGSAATTNQMIGFLQAAGTVAEGRFGARRSCADIFVLSRCGQNSETIRMAYISTHVLHSTAKCRHGVQSDAGVAAALLVTVHAGCLHAGNLASKTRCASRGPCAGLRF